MTDFIHPAHEPADFLVFVGDHPYLVEWQPAGITGRFTFRLADRDFAPVWAADPVSIDAPAEAVRYWGVARYAEHLAEIHHNAELAALEYEREAA